MDNPERSAALFDAIFDTAVDAILVADASGIILNANPTACEMFQRSAEELAGHFASYWQRTGCWAATKTPPGSTS